MSFVVGATELVFFEIAIVAFVGLAIPQLAKQFMQSKYSYKDLTKKISWAPPPYLFGVIWSVMYLALLPISVYRIRILGNWQSGVNLTQLIFFWVLQFVLVLYNFLYIVNLWLGFLTVLVSLGFAITTTCLFFPLDTAAGVLLLPLDVWLVIATILALTIALNNRNPKPISPPKDNNMKDRLRRTTTTQLY
jgi:tryptophan-rich sensory protein